MSISSFFSSRIAAVPTPVVNRAAPWGFNGGRGELVIECSSRPTKKGTAHHMKTRPRKTQPWDVRRKPTVYAPLPPLPPDWTLVSSSSGEVGAVSEMENVASSPSPPLSSQAPPTIE